MISARPFVLASLSLSGLLLAACEPEVGMPCSANTEYVKDRVVQESGYLDLVRDINFENCTSLLCVSSDGSRPYCTRPCDTDLDCGADGFVCQQAVNFGPLACKDNEEFPTCIRPDGTPSENPQLYCVAPAEVIAERDKQLGRSQQ